MMKQEINSPFRYAGGKFYARKLILEHIRSHTQYIEPFCGGASIFFAKDKVENNWLNDIDKELVNCLTIIRDKPDDLIALLSGEEATKERHHYFKNTYRPRKKIERAYRWYYLNRTSYSGIMNMKNCYWGYGKKFSMVPENWPRNILRTSNKLQNVKLTSFDFTDVIDQAEDNSFLFVDPPYYNADQNKFYTHFFTSDDHARLMEALKRNSKRLKFLITYDNTSEVIDLYSWASEHHEKEWFYTISRTDDQRKNGTNRKGSRYKGKELFITNYNSITEKQQVLF